MLLCYLETGLRRWASQILQKTLANLDRVGIKLAILTHYRTIARFWILLLARLAERTTIRLQRWWTPEGKSKTLNNG